MKTVNFIILILLSLLSYGQSANEKFDDLRLFTSPISESKIDPSLIHTLEIDSNIKASTGVYINVKLKRERIFHENGNLRFQRFYKKNKPFGKWTYYTNTGHLKYTLHNNPEYFVIKLHYPNQNIRSLRKYKTQITTSLGGCKEEDYYPSGRMQAYGNKKPEKIANSWKLVEHGKWFYFYPSGKLESKGSFKNGVKHGTWINFNEQGKKIRVSKFKTGQLVSQKKL